MGLVVVKKKQGAAMTSVQHKTKGVESDEQQQQEPVGPVVSTEQPHALIEYSTSMTRNLGNYNSVKIAVGVTLPARLDEIEDVFKFGEGWVNAKMEALLADVPEG